MELKTALDGISAKSYFKYCNLKYSGLQHHGFAWMTWDELPPSMQLGIKRLILDLHSTQKIVFYYELDYTLNRLKNCGVKFRQFFEECDINPSFYSNKYLSKRDYSDNLITIRLAIIRLINRLLEFILHPTKIKNEIQHLCT